MSDPQPGLGRCVLLLAAALLANTVAGPLVLDLVDYPVSETVLNQLIGLELVTTFLVVPVAVLSGVLALRGQHEWWGCRAAAPASRGRSSG